MKFIFKMHGLCTLLASRAYVDLGEITEHLWVGVPTAQLEAGSKILGKFLPCTSVSCGWNANKSALLH